MKRIILMLDAAADLPFATFRDQTPLQAARLTHARALAAEGSSGTLRVRRADSAASLALLGEALGLSRRQALGLVWGPLAAAAVGWEPDPGRLRALGQFITVDGGEVRELARPTSLAEQDQLLRDLEIGLANRLDAPAHFRSLRPGLFVMDLPLALPRPGLQRSPMDILGQGMTLLLKGMDPSIVRLLEETESLLSAHPINQVRLDLKENPLNAMWLWSGGASGGVPGKSAAPCSQAVLTCDPLATGLAMALGRECLRLEDPYAIDRIDAAFDVSDFLAALDRHEEIVVWVHAPFSAGRFEGPEEKVRRLDAVDYYVTGPLRSILLKHRPSRMCLLAAGLRHRGLPEKGRAPFVLWGEGTTADSVKAWNETDALAGALGSPKLTRLLARFRA